MIAHATAFFKAIVFFKMLYEKKNNLLRIQKDHVWFEINSHLQAKRRLKIRCGFFAFYVSKNLKKKKIFF